jgi:lipoyl(octanoyl) transferase
MIELIDLGFKHYKDTWDFQKELVEKRIRDEIPDTLIFVEHEPVFTRGRNRDLKNIHFAEDYL